MAERVDDQRNGLDSGHDREATEPGSEPSTVRTTSFRVGTEEFTVVSVPLPDADDLSVLTSAERDVCRRLLRGRSNAEIAQARGRSDRTIANQVAAIFHKLGVGSRAELAARYSLTSNHLRE